MSKKTCSKCHILKSLDEFYTHSSSKDGMQSNCKLCQKEYRDGIKESNPETYAKYNLVGRVKSKYKMTLNEYELFLSVGCEVCGSEDNLCVDHDHACCPGQTTCGKCIRGVLCHSCNFGEGKLKGDPKLANVMEQYMLKNVNLLGELMVSEDQLIR